MRSTIAMLAILTTGVSPALADPAATPAPESHPAPQAAEEPLDEKAVRLQGYRATMLKGEMVYCRREIPLGSHLPTTLKCVTIQEAKLMAEEGRQTTERIQRSMQACLASGGPRGPSSAPANCGN